MRPLLALPASSLVLALLVSACGGDEAAAPNDDDGALQTSSSSSSGEPTTSSSSSSSGAVASSSSGAVETCKATFTWLQKDAYKETGGRTVNAWPPHTTTTLAVTCNDQPVDSAFQANHGSEPGSKDAAGRDFLDPVHAVSVPGTRAQLTQLLDVYRTCECEPESFLSMNSLNQTVVEDLLSEFVTLVDDGATTCTGDTTKADLVSALQAQDFEAALLLVPECTFPGADGTPVDTLNEALTLAIASTGNVLADYHVCNNDAVLQASLVTSFQSTGTIGTCDRTSAACKGPLWMYDPAE